VAAVGHGDGIGMGRGRTQMNLGSRYHLLEPKHGWGLNFSFISLATTMVG
jgi:hypothetical protein